MGKELKVDGRSLDMWAFGMLSCEVLTFFALEDVVKKCTHWKNHVWPTMCYIMDERNFGTMMKEHLWWLKLSDAETNSARNFVQSFLRNDPQLRTRPAFALEHRFLGKGSDLGPHTDTLWSDHPFSFNFNDL